jgi:hypothetical protein
MKRSQIAVLSVLGLIALIMLVLMGIGRVAVGKTVDFDSEDRPGGWDTSGADASRTLDLTGFDSVVVEGAWMVRIKQGENYGVEILYPSGKEDQILVEIRGSDLVLDTRDWHARSGEGLIAEISMPALSEIRIEGAADATFSGFNEDSLDVIIGGAASIKGYDTEVKNLRVRLQGIGQIDLEDVQSVNAEVDLEGAGEIRLYMDGGVLDGSLEGLGSIVYSGIVSEENIKVEGLGKVRFK